MCEGVVERKKCEGVVEREEVVEEEEVADWEADREWVALNRDKGVVDGGRSVGEVGLDEDGVGDKDEVRWASMDTAGLEGMPRVEVRALSLESSERKL